MLATSLKSGANLSIQLYSAIDNYAPHAGRRADAPQLPKAEVLHDAHRADSLTLTGARGQRRATPCGAMAGDNAKFILCICVSNGYTDSSMKDSGLRIRVQRELRDRFNEACRAEDRSAAQVLREFMRAYVERHESAADDPGQGASLRGPAHDY